MLCSTCGGPLVDGVLSSYRKDLMVLIDGVEHLVKDIVICEECGIGYPLNTLPN